MWNFIDPLECQILFEWSLRSSKMHCNAESPFVNGKWQPGFRLWQHGFRLWLQGFRLWQRSFRLQKSGLIVYLQHDVRTRTSGPGHEKCGKINFEFDPLALLDLDLDFGWTWARAQTRTRIGIKAAKRWIAVSDLRINKSYLSQRTNPMN